MALVATLVVLGACVAADDSIDDGDLAVSDDTIFFDTVVQLLPDGTFVAGEPRAVTAGEQRAQNELRRAIEAGEAEVPGPGIAEDFSCLYDSFWFYSRSDFTGSRICFAGYGVAWLEDYTRYILVNGHPLPIGDWQITSGSYWPGVRAGWMYNFHQVDGPGTQWSLSWSSWGYRKVWSEPTPAWIVTL